MPFGGRYVVKQRIGKGGMAEVYLAVTRGAAGFERPVVLKRLLPDMAVEPATAAAFLDEARLMAQLDHPHIGQVFDVGEGPEGVYVVMEHIDGADLRVLMERGRKALDPGIAALIVRDVCEALDYGYNRTDENGVPLRLIHRDVSLSNVMLSLGGVVKLVDFGLAKALTASDRERTAEGVVKGKWSYVAPEVLRGGKADHRSDIFSAGVVLWELCAGRKLYRPSSNIAQVIAEREFPPPSLSSVAPQAGPELDAITARALELDPELRFQFAEEMASALDAVVHQRRVRPHHLVEMMAALFAPRRPGPTLTMKAVSLPSIAGADDGGDTTTDGTRTIPRELSELEALAAEAAPLPAILGPVPTPTPSMQTSPAVPHAAVRAALPTPQLDRSREVTGRSMPSESNYETARAPRHSDFDGPQAATRISPARRRRGAPSPAMMIAAAALLVLAAAAAVLVLTG